jgi:hypothetical protein
MHTQHNIRRQYDKSKVNTCKHQHLVVPWIAANRASSSGVVPRIAADRASFGAIEEVVNEVVYRVIQSQMRRIYDE